MPQNNFMKLQRFFIYGLAGWGVEILWTGLGSMLKGDWHLAGKTYIWMLPIYGLAIFFEPLHNSIRHWPWVVRGLIWVGATWCIEFFTGGTLVTAVGTCPWDYSHKTPYSVLGLIRLDYAPAWFILGLLFEKFHDWLKEKIN